MSELQERDRQLRAAGVLRKLVERGFRDRLPALDWHISMQGEITGRVVRPVSAGRRHAELRAWADALGFEIELQDGLWVPGLKFADAAGELDQVQVVIVADVPVTYATMTTERLGQLLVDAEPELAARTKVTSAWRPAGESPSTGSPSTAVDAE